MKIVVAIVLVVVIILVIRQLKNQVNTKEISDPTGFLNALHLWVQDREGGFVTSGSGGDKKLKRSPWIYEVNGHTYINPRANKGISYSVFLKYAPKFGYKADKETFGEMPFDLFSKIYDAIAVSFGLRYTKNLVLAAYLGGWIWGSGSISATNLSKMKNILKENINDREKLRRMIGVRKGFFASLHTRNPEDFPQSLIDAYDHRQDLFWDSFNGKLAA